MDMFNALSKRVGQNESSIKDIWCAIEELKKLADSFQKAPKENEEYADFDGMLTIAKDLENLRQDLERFKNLFG